MTCLGVHGRYKLSGIQGLSAGAGRLEGWIHRKAWDLIHGIYGMKWNLYH